MGGRGRGAYYKAKYGGGGDRGGVRDRNRNNNSNFNSNSNGNPSYSSNGGSKEQLSSLLNRIHKSQYPAYKQLLGTWNFGSYTLSCHYVQGDSYASPSSFAVTLPGHIAGYPSSLFSLKTSRIALADYISRAFVQRVSRDGMDMGSMNTGWSGRKGGELNMVAATQYVMERSNVTVDAAGSVTARFTVNLPASGRSIEGEWACDILLSQLPCVIEDTLPFSAHDVNALNAHVQSIEDQEELRNCLDDAGLIAFVRQDAILPRIGGDSDLPMDLNDAVPFSSPPSMIVGFSLRHSGEVTGMGVPRGVTLLTGGGFHGKSTFLQAIQAGIYNKVPGDGREFVVSVASAVKIRAEDKRCVHATNISTFINNLPGGRTTKAFSTADASGSTSQAVNIIEAVEVGATCLLIDEDTCATNFMTRDHRMSMLVAKEKEPITPFISKVRSLYEDHGISSLMVVGGAGDFFEVADKVVMLDNYHTLDVTDRARQIVSETSSTVVSHSVVPRVTARRLDASGFDPIDPENRRALIKVRGSTQFGLQITFGACTLDLSNVETLVEAGQARAIGDAIVFARTTYMDGKRTLREIVEAVNRDLDSKGLDILSSQRMESGYVRPRIFELAAAINRLRSATIFQ